MMRTLNVAHGCFPRIKTTIITVRNPLRNNNNVDHSLQMREFFTSGNVTDAVPFLKNMNLLYLEAGTGGGIINSDSFTFDKPTGVIKWLLPVTERVTNAKIVSFFKN